MQRRCSPFVHLRYNASVNTPKDDQSRFRFSLVVGLIALLACAMGAYFATRQATAEVPDIQGFLWPDPVILHDFTLLEAHGGVFDAARLDGHWTLLFFGFTHCPDVCPTTLNTLKTVRSALRDVPAFDAHAQILFVSVDPARDTPAVLRQYVDYFDPHLLAATAAPDELNALTRQLGVLYSKVETDKPSVYSFDHTAAILLIGPARQFLGVFSPPHHAAEIETAIRRILAFMQAKRV